MRSREFAILTIFCLVAIAMAPGAHEKIHTPPPEGTVSVTGDLPNLGPVFVAGSGEISPELREQPPTIAPPSPPLTIMWVASADGKQRVPEKPHAAAPDEETVARVTPIAEPARSSPDPEASPFPEAGKMDPV